MGQLVFCRDGAEVLRFPLTTEEVRLGRHASNDISLPDPAVSRFHAKLCREGESYRLINLSRKGLKIKGERADSVLLKDLDTFEVGAWRILFEEESPIDETDTIGHQDLGFVFADAAESMLFHGMVGHSQVMQEVFTCIEQAAPSVLPVLVHGETGTGKELVARAVHEVSQRTGSFLALNCGAISPHLIESELFGHERGAFTGAVVQHKGAFEAAHQGTLFLDEVAELPLELQAKLLRVLEEGQVRRVGGSREFPIDVRIIAATHRDLNEEVAEGRFREDLYYRLLGVLIELPPLRDRQDDIPLLANHFLEQASPEKVRRELSDDAIQRLQGHKWPGNIRELRNVLARSLVFCENHVLRATDLRFVRLKTATPKPSLQGAERKAIIAALEASQGNKRQAAERLGIAKSTLFRKIRDYDLSEFE